MEHSLRLGAPRAGLVARGSVDAVIGVLALKPALGDGGKPPTGGAPDRRGHRLRLPQGGASAAQQGAPLPGHPPTVERSPSCVTLARIATGDGCAPPSSCSGVADYVSKIHLLSPNTTVTRNEVAANPPRQRRTPPRDWHGLLGRENLQPWLSARSSCPAGHCLRHRRPDARATVVKRRGPQRVLPLATEAGVRRRFAPGQSRYSHPANSRPGSATRHVAAFTSGSVLHARAGARPSKRQGSEGSGCLGSRCGRRRRRWQGR